MNYSLLQTFKTIVCLNEHEIYAENNPNSVAFYCLHTCGKQSVYAGI